MKVGDIVRHSKRTEWGNGVITNVDKTNLVVHFEQGGKITLKLDLARPFLEEVPRTDIPQGSPLLNPEQWGKIGMPVKQNKSAKSGATTPCGHCKKKLRKSIFSADKKLKSCPNCSGNDGSYHVFYPFPDAFGQSEARENDTNDEGAQSWCTACRQEEEVSYPSQRCMDVKQK